MTPEMIIEHDGIQQPIIEWALDYGITPAIIIARLERGLSVSDAITTPMQTGHHGQRLPIFSAEQAKSIRRAKRYTANGVIGPLKDWAERSGVSTQTLRARLTRMTLEEAIALGAPKAPGRAPKLYTYEGQTRTVKGWAKHTGIPKSTITHRLLNGASIAEVIERGGTKGRPKGASPTADRQAEAEQADRGVVLDFTLSTGTGAGSVLRENPETAFQKEAAE